MLKRLAALLFISSAFTLAVGCAGAETGEDEEGGGEIAAAGDGTAEDEVVAEKQLMGNDMPEKTVSLTFDDGPGPRTKELSEFLASKGIKGTFFINGNQVPGRQSAIDSIVGRGHLLANHTHTHKLLTRLSSNEVVSEVAKTDAIIAAAQPNGPWLLRAPFGGWNGSTTRAVNGTPMSKYVGSIFWDQGGQLTERAAADWDCWGKKVSIQRCGELYLNEIRSKKRGIVLMHDIQDKTIDMVKDVVVPALIAEGWKFVGVDEAPSVKKAIGGNAAVNAGTPPAPGAPDRCQSATLGRMVDENVCVQSKSTQKWSRCLDGEWIASEGPGDTKCKERFPLN